jgi:sodium transport system permease protein
MTTASHTPSYRPGSRIGTIFRKEFREIFRDRRTVYSVVISPLLITPLLFALLGSLINKQATDSRTETLTLGIVGQKTAPKLWKRISGRKDVRFVPTTLAEAEAQVKSRNLKAVAVLPADADSRLDHDLTIGVKVLMDPGNESSRTGLGRLDKVFRELGTAVIKERLNSKKLSEELATPFSVEEQPISSGGGAATLILTMMLPYTLAIAAFGGGIYAANDQVAGEKERGTLETLLVTPASRRDIVLGKFLAVAGVCLVSSLLAVVGLMIPFFSGLKVFEWLAKGGVTLSPIAILVILIVQIPLAVLFAGILLALSTFARNQKEAQTYLAPLFVLILFPAMASMFLKTESARSMALVPVLNATLIIKQGLANSFDAVFISLAFLASAAYAALALTFAIRLFHKEGVLIKA